MALWFNLIYQIKKVLNSVVDMWWWCIVCKVSSQSWFEGAGSWQHWCGLDRLCKKLNDVEYVQCKSRPSVKEWKSIEEGLIYKNDNTLREYQLEGLNWLLFCYHSRYYLVFCDRMTCCVVTCSCDNKPYW